MRTRRRAIISTRQGRHAPQTSRPGYVSGSGTITFENVSVPLAAASKAAINELQRRDRERAEVRALPPAETHIDGTGRVMVRLQVHGLDCLAAQLKEASIKMREFGLAMGKSLRHLTDSMSVAARDRFIDDVHDRGPDHGRIITRSVALQHFMARPIETTLEIEGHLE